MAEPTKLEKRDALLTSLLLLAVNAGIDQKVPDPVVQAIDKVHRHCPGYKAGVSAIGAAAQVVCAAILQEGCYAKK